MLFHFIGDVHGRWDDFSAVLKKSTADVVFQVGDFGFFPKLWGSRLDPLPGRLRRESAPPGASEVVYFIDGNHDDIPSLQAGLFSHPSFSYCPRPTLLTFGATRILLMGGGVSLDRRRRTEGVDWFPSEVPSTQEMLAFQDRLLCGVDIVVTHEMPTSVVDKVFDGFYHDTPVGRDLEAILQSVPSGLRPKYWISGHYHEDARVNLYGTRFYTVGCCHPYRGRKASNGLLISHP